MSWFLEYHAASRAECKQAIVERAKDNDHIPAAVVTAAHILIDALPDTTAHDVYLKTSGHMDYLRNRSDIRLEVYLQPEGLTEHPPGE